MSGSPMPSGELLSSADAPLRDAALRGVLFDRLAAFDPGELIASGAWEHQVEGVTEFRANAAAMLEGEATEQGMSILHATGTGKTNTLATIARMVCLPAVWTPDSTGAEAMGLNVLWFTSGDRIKHQTVYGEEDGVSPIRERAPELTVGEYNGRQPAVQPLVTVMNYQALDGAIRRGDIASINPVMLVCDEAHHIIDGVWAEQITDLSIGRLLVGATASEAYSKDRTVRKVFPVVLSRKSFREAIEDEEGILADFQGYLYEGTARIQVSNPDAESFSDEDVFRAIATSPDNIRAAKIAVGEVAQGRRGVIRCVPGGDRVHAKIMAQILSHTEVNAPDGRRMIRAAHVDGTMAPDEINGILADYKAGRLDVLAYVRALGEGWNSPETDFGIDMVPTTSWVNVEQPAGRVVRGREGKVATWHQFIYPVEGVPLRQITFLDILGETEVQQGRSYSAAKKDGDKSASRGDSRGGFSQEQFMAITGLAGDIASLDNRLLQEIRIGCGQERVPKDWPSATKIGIIFGLPETEIESIFKELRVPSQTKVVDKQERTYYAPSSLRVLAEHLGIEPLTDDRMTERELVDYYHDLRANPSRIPPARIRQSMLARGVQPERRFHNNLVAVTYPYNQRHLPLIDHLRTRSKLMTETTDENDLEVSPLQRPFA